MAVFATEEAVRLLVQIDDVAVATTALVTACIAEAHERVLADLDGAMSQVSPPAALVQGEALLASAALMRALASRDAVDQVELQIGGQRIDAGHKFASLMSISRRFEKEGARLLGAFSVLPGPVPPGELTASTPVLGV